MNNDGLTLNQLAERNAALVTDVEKLRAERYRLAAENMAMIRLLTDISDNHVEYLSEGEGTMLAGVPLDYVSEINMYVSRDVNAENPFPATDRILAAVEARGVEKAIAHLEKKFRNIGVQIMNLQWLADSLREGADK
ncbi:hypothetical protein ACNVD5_02615 [Klebsiella pneumoniae]|uniref:hypothetical protein n=1 Tax=Klebsiella pneumoniae TaxID=573 RepID=UPI003AB22B04